MQNNDGKQTTRLQYTLATYSKVPTTSKKVKYVEKPEQLQWNELKSN